jgi:hypothetical protein
MGKYQIYILIFGFLFMASPRGYSQGLDPLPVAKVEKLGIQKNNSDQVDDIYEQTECFLPECGPYAGDDNLRSVIQASIQGERLNLGHFRLPDSKTVKSVRLIRTSTSPQKARFDFSYFQEVCKNFEFLDQKKKDISFQCIRKGSEKVISHIDIDFSSLTPLKEKENEVYELRAQIVKQKIQIQLYKNDKEIPASFGMISQIKKMFTEVDETFQPQP